MSLVRTSAAILFVGAFGLSAQPSLANQATYTMPVSVNVTPGCTVSAAPLIFLMLVPTNANIDSTSTITVSCSPDLDYTIDLDFGLHPQGTNRRVYNADANAFMTYEIYKDPPRSQVWGRGNTRNLAGNSGITGTTVYPVYGRLQARANASAGGYTDLVTVTLNF